MSQTHHITELLQAWSNGDSQALSKLIPLVDYELQKIAHAYMLEENSDHTLQTSALVNEVIIRLIAGEKISWQNRHHFYALVAKRMRQILIDHARAERAKKRGGRAEHVAIEDATGLSVAFSEKLLIELIMLDDALKKLAQVDARKEELVELKYFGGCTIQEIADLLQVDASTVERDWRLARSWLKREMTE